MFFIAVHSKQGSSLSQGKIRRWIVMNYKTIASFLKILLITNLLTIGLYGCGGGGGDSVIIFEEKEPFSFEVTVDNHDQFNLLGVNSEIIITGESGADSVMITAIKIVQSTISTLDAKEHLQELEVDWESVANTVSVETIQPKDTAERNYRVDYTITLPKYFKIQVNSVNAVVTLNSIENDVTVNIANGEVTLLNIYGSALVNLANGAIDSEVALPLQGTIDLKVATGGHIHLAIPINTSAEFSANTLFGNINVSSVFVFQDEVKTSTSLSGTLGSGQGMISLGTMGDISVSGF
jgi:hypothetical protein